MGEAGNVLEAAAAAMAGWLKNMFFGRLQQHGHCLQPCLWHLVAPCACLVLPCARHLCGLGTVGLVWRTAWDMTSATVKICSVSSSPVSPSSRKTEKAPLKNQGLSTSS